MTFALGALATAFLVTWAAMSTAARLARRVQALATPNPDVRSHTETVTLLGGLAIMLGLAPVMVYPVWSEPRWWGLVAAIAMVMALGLYKDCGKSVAPPVQLVIQAAAAAIVVSAGFHVSIGDGGLLELGSSILLVVWLINGVNFLDVLDGLAGGIAAITGVAFFAVAMGANALDAGLLALGLAGAACGFLLYNRPPARIFMGDVGSFPIGVVLAVLLMRLGESDHRAMALAPILALPLAEVGLTSMVRLVKRRSPLRGGPEHLHLWLVNRGWPVGRVLALWYGVAEIPVAQKFCPGEASAIKS